MSHSLVKVDIHLIFHVKTSGMEIRESDLSRLFNYIAGVIRGVGGIPFEVGGMNDHIHVLASLPKSMSVAEFAKVVKSNSSRWVKSLSDPYTSFQWQEGYGAFSVSPTLLDKTKTYIRNQASHHRHRSFQEEYRLFLAAHGIHFDFLDGADLNS